MSIFSTAIVIYLLLILMEEILFYTGKSPLGDPFIQWNTEIDFICPLSVNPLMTSRVQKYRPLTLATIFIGGLVPGARL